VHRAWIKGVVCCAFNHTNYYKPNTFYQPPPFGSFGTITTAFAPRLGDVSGSMFDAIQQARERGIPVVISTRVPTGRVFPLAAGKGSALALKRIGCVLADDLSPQKARVLLMLALTKTHDPAALQKYFDN